MHVQGKILILEPLGIELDLFIPRTKTNYVNNLIFKIPAKTHFLCLQALLNVEVLENTKICKNVMSGENSEKKKSGGIQQTVGF